MGITAVNPGDTRALQNIADTICSSKKVVVITGAGISTNSGIPDFRSTDGLYNLVKARYPSTIVKGKDLFDSVLFSDPTSTSLFYTFLAELRKSVLNVKDTTSTHKFIRMLAETGRLLRCYTQNIDGLESREGLTTDLGLGKGGVSRKRKRCSLAGVPGELGLVGGGVPEVDKGCQVVQLHGELDSLRCMHCQGKCDYDADKVQSLMDGRAPDCPACLRKAEQRMEAGKRGTAVGGLRPNIVLYGEEHPEGDLIGTITTSDLFAKPDLMIIFGTSLKVHGLKKIVKAFASSIHARKADVPRVIYVNNQPAAHSTWKDVIDVWVNMDCDKFVGELKKRRSAIWERQEKLEVGFRRAAGTSGKGSGNGGKIVKSATAATRIVKGGTAKGRMRPSDDWSDKENGSDSEAQEDIKMRSPSKRKSTIGTTIKKATTSRKPLLSKSTSMSSLQTVKKPTCTNTPNSPQRKILATPKSRKTPLPTPPSSISKPRRQSSSSSSLSPSPMKTQHRDPQTPTRTPARTNRKTTAKGPLSMSYTGQNHLGSAPNTPSKLRMMSSTRTVIPDSFEEPSSSDDIETDRDTDLDLSLLETPTKRRKMDYASHSSITLSTPPSRATSSSYFSRAAASSSQTPLFRKPLLKTPEPADRAERKSMMEAVLILSPRKEELSPIPTTNAILLPPQVPPVTELVVVQRSTRASVKLDLQALVAQASPAGPVVFTAGERASPAVAASRPKKIFRDGLRKSERRRSAMV